MAHGTTLGAAPVDSLPYGTPRQVAAMLYGIGLVLRDEPQDQWKDPGLRASTESLRDLLTARLTA